MERLTIRNSDGTVSQPTSTTVEAAFYGWPTMKTPTANRPRSASWSESTARPSMNCALCAADTSGNTKEPAMDAGGKNLCDRR